MHSVYCVLATKDNWESVLILTQQAHKDLNWWLSALKEWNGAPLRTRTIDVQIETDASQKGWGNVYLDKEVAENWPLSVSYEHSNCRELLAICMMVQSFADQLQGKGVQILSDNITSVAYINRFGGSCEKLSTVMSTLWSFAHDHNIELSTKHLAGVKNVHADQLSRRVSPYKWQLHPRLFQYIDNMWGPHSINCFAAKVDTLLPSYNSYRQGS